jgi:hypothetical protein
VYNHRKIQLRAKCQVCVEESSLHISWSVVIEEVEARLTDRDHLVMTSEFTNGVYGIRRGFPSLVRVDTSRAPRAVDTCDEINGRLGITHIRSDRHETGHPCLRGPTQHRLPVLPEGGVGKMTVAIEELDEAPPHCCRSRGAV